MGAATTALSAAILKHRATEAFRNRRAPDPWTPEKHHVLQQRWYRENKAKHAADGKRWVAEHYPQRHAIYVRFVDKARMAAMQVLGGPICNHCGYDADFRALCIDHIKGGGQQEMRDVNFNMPKFYRRIIAAGAEMARAVYQVLCANCNRIKQFENKEFGRGPKFYREQKERK